MNKELSSLSFLLVLSVLLLIREPSLIPVAGQLTPSSMTTAATSLYSINSSSQDSLSSSKIKNFGAWASYQIPVESMNEIEEQKAAIDTLLRQGYTEYYFPLGNFESESVRSTADNLLTAADGTDIKMIAILLPPSEAGSGGNYDWEGWINYLNSLKEKHPSLDGFVIDDFNWYEVEDDENKENGNSNDDKDDDDDDNDIKYNVNFMLESDLRKALEKKRNDLYFYPLIYIEGAKTNTVKRQYYNLTDGIILASVDFYNVTKLEHNIDVFGKVFGNDNKTIRYLIYTAPTSNYTSQGYYPPSDRLILATLHTALRANSVDEGIVVWRNTDNHAITDYLSNQKNSKYLSLVSLMEELQLKDENNTEKLVRDFSSALAEEEEEEEGKGESDDNSVDRPWLGLSVTDLTPDLAEDRDLPTDSEGVAVQSVIPGSPASKAGIEGILLDVDKDGYLITRGDVIVSIDGNDIEDTNDLQEAMEDKKVGDLINFGINRNGKLTNVVVNLESLPN